MLFASVLGPSQDGGCDAIAVFWEQLVFVVDAVQSNPAMHGESEGDRGCVRGTFCC